VTPLPSKVKHAFVHGLVDALAHFGLKTAAEEIRLKIPKREFHGWDSAFKTEKQKNEKKAEGETPDPLEPQGSPEDPVERLTELLQQLPLPGEAANSAMTNPLDRSTMWSGPSSLGAGDAGNRTSDMGQPTGVGMV
jgi:hypothetical protein